MRVVTRILCAVLAAALAATALVAIVEIALALAARGPWLVDGRAGFDDLSTEPWSSTTHRLILLLALAVGLVLLLVAWAPRRPVTLSADADRVPVDVDVTLRRRDVERRIEAAARDVPYIVDASAHADGRVTLTAGSTRAADQTVRREVEEAVRRTLHQLALDPGAARVRVRTSAGRAA